MCLGSKAFLGQLRFVQLYRLLLLVKLLKPFPYECAGGQTLGPLDITNGRLWVGEHHGGSLAVDRVNHWGAFPVADSFNPQGIQDVKCVCLHFFLGRFLAVRAAALKSASVGRPF